MADIVILGMEMPESCDECRLFNECWCMALGVENWRKSYNKPPDGERLDDCPLVPLPEKHGRLVDASVAEKKIKEMYMTMVNSRSEGSTEVAFGLHLAASIIRTDTNVPTIVPAEGGGEE